MLGQIGPAGADQSQILVDLSNEHILPCLIGYVSCKIQTIVNNNREIDRNS